MGYRVKTNYDRGYVNAMDKVRVFIESNQKVMYVNTDEYKNAKNGTFGLCQRDRVASCERNCESNPKQK